MKYLIMIVLAVGSLTVSATEKPNWCDSAARLCGILANPETGGEIYKLPSPPIYGGGEILRPRVYIPMPKQRTRERPSMQYLQILAEAEDKAQESARQWWINFFNKGDKTDELFSL